MAKMASIEPTQSDVPQVQHQLFEAARSGDVAAIESLLGATGDLVNRPVPMATFRGLSYGQTVFGLSDFRVTFRDATPLHVATYFRHPDVVALLLRRGADVAAAASRVVFGPDEPGDGEPWPKWHYKDATALHLSVSGEEIPSFEASPENDVHRRRSSVVSLLLRHIRKRMYGTVGTDDVHVPRRDWSAVVDAECTLTWFYRAEPDYVLKDVAALHLAVCFAGGAVNNSLFPFSLPHSSDFALNLLDLVHARPNSSACVGRPSSGVRGSLESARSLAFQRVGRDGALHRACHKHFFRIMKGYRSAWRRAVLGALRGVAGLDDAMIAHVVGFAEMSSPEVAFGLMDGVLDDETKRAKRAYLDAPDEKELMRIALSHDILL